MKKEYDFSKAKRGAVLPTMGKTRITLYLDNDVLEHFRVVSEKTGRGYQTLINEALKTQVGRTEQPLTPEAVRRKEPIPRHAEINEKLARAILRRAARRE